MSGTVETRLTASETDLLDACEAVIQRGMGIFVEVGEALMAVRDNKLYRVGFATFEDYCSKRWQIERAHAYRLVDSARVVQMILSPIGDKISSDEQDVSIPATESQARELAPLLDDPNELREVWQQANERTDGKPTAEAIREVRDEREEERQRPPKPPKWDPEDRRRHEEEVRRIRAIEDARHAAQTIVTELRSLVVTVVTGSRFGESGLVTTQMVKELHEAIDLLEGEL